MKNQVLHTVLCFISGEAAREIWNWSLLEVKGLTVKTWSLVASWSSRTNVSSPEICCRRLRRCYCNFFPRRSSIVGISTKTSMNQPPNPDPDPRREETAHRQQRVQACLRVLAHASTCHSSACDQLPPCANMKRIIRHARSCTSFAGDCRSCADLLRLCCAHAGRCQRRACAVPFCRAIRIGLHVQRRRRHRREPQQQQLGQEEQEQRRRRQQREQHQQQQQGQEEQEQRRQMREQQREQQQQQQQQQQRRRRQQQQRQQRRRQMREQQQQEQQQRRQRGQRRRPQRQGQQQNQRPRQAPAGWRLSRAFARQKSWNRSGVGLKRRWICGCWARPRPFILITAPCPSQLLPHSSRITSRILLENERETSR